MDNANAERKIIDHLQKRNCQECGAFVLSNDEEDLARNGSSSKRKCRDNSLSKKNKPTARVRVSRLT